MQLVAGDTRDVAHPAPGPDDFVTGRDSMPMRSHFTQVQRWMRDAGPQACVRPAAIVMGHPLCQHTPKMALIERDHEVQTLAPNAPDQPFAMGVWLRRPHRRVQYLQAHRPRRSVDAFGIDAVAIMDDESVQLIAGRDHPDCCEVHAAVGCSVTFQCRIRRLPSSKTTTRRTLGTSR